MMKLGELVKISEALRKLNSRLVKVVGYKTGYDNKRIPTAVARTWTPMEIVTRGLGGRKVRRAADQSRYTSSIKFLDKKYHVVVSCSCPDYMFRWEWANHERGASEIIFGNGDPPDETNPGYVPGMCVARGSLVTTTVGDKFIEDIVAGDMVLTLEGYNKVVATLCTGVKDTLRVTTKHGHSLALTPEHPVLMFENGFFVWCKAEDLATDDQIFHLTGEPQGSSRFGQKIHTAILAGLLIAEGDEFGYAPAEPVVREIFEASYRACFDTEPKYKNPNAQHLMLDNLQEIAQTLGFNAKHSHHQRIPKAFFVESHDFRSCLLYGLFMGDGHVSKDGTYASYGSSSPGLARDVQQLCRTLGIYSAIRNNGLSRLWHVRIPVTSMARFRKCMGILKFKYPITKAEPALSGSGGGLESSLPLDFSSLTAHLRTHLRKELRKFPEERTYLVPVKSDRILAYLKRKAPAQLFKVKLASSHKPVLHTPKEVRDWADIQTKITSIVTSAIPMPPEWLSKSKLLAWVNHIEDSIDVEQLAILKQVLKGRVSVEAVSSVRPAEEVKVYDLEVEGAEHFTANGIVVHNCKHLLALRKLIKEKHGV